MTRIKAVQKRPSKAGRAVSPVIGVILMVAITVLLAAVVGTFVLDVGQEAMGSAPQVSMSVETVDTTTNNVTIEHNGGEALIAEDSRVVFKWDGNTTTYTATGEDTLSVGDEAVFSLNSSSTSGDWAGFISTDASDPIADGQTLTVQVIDTQSQKIIFETDITA